MLKFKEKKYSQIPAISVKRNGEKVKEISQQRPFTLLEDRQRIKEVFLCETPVSKMPGFQKKRIIYGGWL